MKENALLFLKGFLIGLGKIIPGVSGGLIAITLGVYEKLISSISNIFKDFKENFTFLMIIGSGILLSVMLGSNTIMYFLNTSYLPTMLLFIGMIIGGIPSLMKIAKGNINKINIITMVIPFLIFFTVSIMTNKVTINMSINIFTLILIGIIDAITMIIPGISGTAVLMTLGVYDTVLLGLSNINHLEILLPFLIGLGSGVLLLSKIIDSLLLKYRITCYFAILGFTISTIFVLLGKTLEGGTYSSNDVIIGLMLLVLGFLVGKKLG